MYLLNQEDDHLFVITNENISKFSFKFFSRYSINFSIHKKLKLYPVQNIREESNLVYITCGCIHRIIPSKENIIAVCYIL